MRRAFVFVLWLVVCFGPSWVRAQTHRAASADGFVDSLGVNVHLHYTDTIYWDFSKLQTALRDLGIRHVRDGLVYDGRPEYYQRYRALAKEGIRATLIVSGDLAKLAAQIEKMKPAVFALEGPNETNLNHWSAEKARGYQVALWKAVKENDALRNLPVVGLSYTDAGYGKQLGDLSGALDFGNIHPYPGGWEPENACNWMHADLASGLASARDTCGDKPIWITEIGYTNALHRKDGHVPISEQAAGIYLPRVYLNCFRQKVVRTFWYELFDLRDDSARKEVEHNFGLLRSDGVTMKPAGRALRNLIRLLADPGPAFETRPLDFRISGGEVQPVLFQKRNGEYWLALWLATSLWDHSRPYGQKQEEGPADRPCTIQFADSPARITAYTDLDAEQPKASELPPRAKLEVVVSERVMLLKVERSQTAR